MQIYEIYIIIEFKKWHILMAQKTCNFGIYQIFKRLRVWHNVYVILNILKKVIFYINNYIN